MSKVICGDQKATKKTTYLKITEKQMLNYTKKIGGSVYLRKKIAEQAFNRGYREYLKKLKIETKDLEKALIELRNLDVN